MKNANVGSRTINFFDRSTIPFRDRKTSEKVVFVILILMYIGGSVYIPFVGSSQKVFQVFGKMMPFSSCTGVLSSLLSISLIFLVVFYGKLGYRTAMILSLLQFPQQIINIIKAPVLAGLPGVFSNILIIITITLIYKNQRRTNEAHRKLRDQAVTDSLTGLQNRFACRFYSQQLIDKKEQFTLVFMDLSNFKGINDMMGRSTGDRVLQAVAERWKSTAETATGIENLIGRVSGDEFVLFIRNYKTQDEVEQTIRQFRSELEKTLTINDIDFHLQASFGYAEYPTDATTRDALVTCVDVALNEAKRSGGTKTIVRFMPGIPKLLADIQLYTNRFASKAIDFLNSFVNAGREQILQKSKPLQSDHFLDVLKEVQIDEGNYAPSG